MAQQQLQGTHFDWHGLLLEVDPEGQEWLLWRQNLAWRPRWIMGVWSSILEFIGAGTRLPDRGSFESMERHEQSVLAHLGFHAALILLAPLPALVEVLGALVVAPAWFIVRKLRRRDHNVHVFLMGDRWVETLTNVNMDQIDAFRRSIADGSHQRAKQDFSSLLVQRPGRVVRPRR